MKFIHEISSKPSFSQKGFDGYNFPIGNKEIEIDFIDAKQGHDTYLISKKCTHIYYILEGEGVFDIAEEKYAVEAGMLVEIPLNIEFSYTGKMKLLLIMNPPFFEGNGEITKMNLNVK